MLEEAKRVLIVDDDAAIVEVVAIALEACGYAVSTAADGAAGLGQVEQTAPQLVLVDLVMPRRNGLTLLARLRTWGAARPRVILMTGCDEAHGRKLARDFDVDEFLSKPFDVDELVALVRRLLEEREPEQVPE